MPSSVTTATSTDGPRESPHPRRARRSDPSRADGVTRAHVLGFGAPGHAVDELASPPVYPSLSPDATQLTRCPVGETVRRFDFLDGQVHGRQSGAAWILGDQLHAQDTHAARLLLGRTARPTSQTSVMASIGTNRSSPPWRTHAVATRREQETSWQSLSRVPSTNPTHTALPTSATSRPLMDSMTLTSRCATTARMLAPYVANVCAATRSCEIRSATV